MHRRAHNRSAHISADYRRIVRNRAINDMMKHYYLPSTRDVVFGSPLLSTAFWSQLDG